MNKTNDQVILSKVLEQKIAETGVSISMQEYFEIFCASEILKDYDLSYDEIEYGIVDAGGDGGIDSIFTFLNGELLREDTQINKSQKKNDIELIIIQSKTSATFGEDPVVKLKETSEDLFNLSHELSDYSQRYNKYLLDRINIFRTAYNSLSSSFPTLSICCYYASTGNEVHPNVQGKVPKLQEIITTLFSGCRFNFEFVGAHRLLELSRDIKSSSRTLEVSESPISTEDGSYICLCNIKKYYEFISDNGKLSRSIFESNVRDYQGSVTVNTAIRQTLAKKDSENFWFLNNGVTIITPRASLAGKKLTIEDPQIVNGLQTSHEVYNYFSSLSGMLDEKRDVLIRVIREEDENARDRIIKATNSQTSIPPASLRCSDEIHRNIEDFLKANEYYYDRKKNHYKSLGKPLSKIISIQFLAQSMMAMVLLKPDSARARPSTLINFDADYNKIFSNAISIDVYLKVILIMKNIEAFLRDCDRSKIELDRKEINNMKFYIAMVSVINLTGVKTGIANKLSSIESFIMDDAELRNCMQLVKNEYQILGGTDQVAKGVELKNRIFEKI
jgi:hypothetical protein